MLFFRTNYIAFCLIFVYNNKGVSDGDPHLSKGWLQKYIFKRCKTGGDKHEPEYGADDP